MGKLKMCHGYNEHKIPGKVSYIIMHTRGRTPFGRVDHRKNSIDYSGGYSDFWAARAAAEKEIDKLRPKTALGKLWWLVRGYRWKAL